MEKSIKKKLCPNKKMQLLNKSKKKNAASNIKQVLEATPHKAAATRPPTTHRENYQS